MTLEIMQTISCADCCNDPTIVGQCFETKPRKSYFDMKRVKIV